MLKARQKEILALFLLACGCIVYLNSFDVPFIYDDFLHIVSNKALQSGDLKKILFENYQGTRPLYNLSLAMSYAIGGNSTFGYHVVSFVLHLLNTLLFLALLLYLHSLPAGKRLFNHWLLPYLIAAIFLVHPLQTESVTYINSRSGLMAGFFGLLATHAFILFRRFKQRRQQTLCLIACLISLCAAMMSKESGAVFALLIPALDLMFITPLSRGKELRARLTTYVTILATLITLPLLFKLFPNPHSSTIGFQVGSAWPHIVTQPRILVYFFGLFFWPFGQNIDYDFPLSTTLLDIKLILSLLTLVGITYLAWKLRRQAPLVAFGIVWFFIHIAPTNSIIPFHDYIAERHLYLPLAGLAMATCGLLAWTLQKTDKRLLNYSIVAFVCLWTVWLGSLTIKRNQLWQSESTLWADAVSKSPNKLRPTLNLATALASEGRHNEARLQFKRALKMKSESPRALFNLGLIAILERDYPTAEGYLTRAHKQRPEHIDTILELAKAHFYQRRYGKARELYQQVLTIESDNRRAKRAIKKTENKMLDSRSKTR